MASNSNRSSFAYGDHRILDNVSFSIPAGVITCLVGDSGSGKTTIADLVIGLITPESGTIRVDGHDLAALHVHSWRHSIGYVPQENLLLHDSILHNVALGDPSLKREDAEHALKIAGAWDFVSRLPDGIDSVVGERGTLLSGGQRQRVMIARALAHHPKLLDPRRSHQRARFRNRSRHLRHVAVVAGPVDDPRGIAPVGDGRHCG